MEELSLIGVIELTDFIHERLVDSTDIYKKGKCFIHVYDNEGNIPHCHIFNKDNTFETCVRLDKAEYFSHGGKYKDRFSNKQLREINDWFKSKNKTDNNFTNWEICKLFWNISATNNNKNKIAIRKQPNYNNLKD